MFVNKCVKINKLKKENKEENESMMLELLFVFILNVFGSTMKVLNTILISKKIMKPVYIIMFLDAIVFMLGIKLVTEGESFTLILAFAFGKVIGAYFANILEDRLALGILEVAIYSSVVEAKQLADILREMGYGVTTVKGYGFNGKPRFEVNVTIQRKELKLLKNVLKQVGYEEAVMIIRELKSVSGKIKTRHNKENLEQFDT